MIVHCDTPPSVALGGWTSWVRKQYTDWSKVPGNMSGRSNYDGTKVGSKVKKRHNERQIQCKKEGWGSG